ncbi:MAG: cytochrome c biogenesis protein CcdA, partial [Nanoarchaeota archaeon]
AGIFKVGLSYIIGIFIAYFGIGIGIFKAVSFSNSPHFAAKIGALLVLLLGLFNIIAFFTKKKNVSLGIPSSSKQYVVSLIQRASVPAAFLVGLFVGICSFGCTAGIYLSIMSMLFVKANYLQGLFYLFLYNLMFILPLIIILILSANKKVVDRIEKLELAKKDYIKLVAGFLMIILAIIIYLIST